MNNENNTTDCVQNVESTIKNALLQYIEQIDKANMKIQDKQQGLIGKLENRKIEMN